MKPWIWLLGTLASTPLLAAEPAWVSTSNGYASEVLQTIAKMNPEMGSQLGIETFDAQVSDLSLVAEQHYIAVLTTEVHKLQTLQSQQQDPRVQQDLAIMLAALQQNISSLQLSEQYQLPFFNVGEQMFGGLQTLLDERNSPARKQQALARLKAYVGQGQHNMVNTARQRTEQALANKTLTPPYQREVEQAISNTPQFIEGMRQLFRDQQLQGWQADMDQLAAQLTDYQQWLNNTLLPAARKSHVMPEVLYANALKNVGVDISPQELIERALFAYAEIRDEMQVLAVDVAKEKGYANSDYRSVIRQLQQQQISGDNVLPFFKQRLADIEKLVKQHDIITMPQRQANIRLASPAESAAIPAAHMNPPRLIGNTGEYGEFVLPMNDPNAGGKRVTDFTSEGFSWTLTVHEARPGHELQFSAMIENGVSLARAIFAMNSANVEGWALYAEAVMKQYLPKDGQLFSLQARLQRAARAFLDPMLNLGMITPEDAKKVLTDDVVLSEAFAQQEVDRYTFKMPGQATSYFYGYMCLRQLRLETELQLKGKFNQKAFHDFILAQGVLPPPLLKKAVEEDFIPKFNQ